MAALKGRSLGLLLLGIGLIIGSCVPVAQTFRAGEPAPVRQMTLAPGGGSATLSVAEDLTVVPVLLLAPAPGAPESGLPYLFSIRDAGGDALIQESGTAAFRPPVDGGRGPATGQLQFRAITIPAGSWTVQFDAGPAAESIGSVTLQLRELSPGLMPALMTTLVLAILGWLAASLGALQWIRAEAARPAPAGPEAARADQARVWTVSCHLSALAGYVFPFGHLLGPLAVWLVKRDVFPAVERAGRSAINFQLSITLYILAGLLLSFFLIGIAVLFVVVVFHFSFVLYAALRAQRGLEVAYPFSIRFI